MDFFFKGIYGMCAIITEQRNGLWTTERLMRGDWLNVCSSEEYAPY